MANVSLEWCLQVLSFIGCLVVITRVIQLRLFQVYPLFFSYLCVPLLLEGVVLRYGVGSVEFCMVFPFLEPVRILGYFLAVWEIATSVSGNQRGLRLAAAIAPAGLILTFVATESQLFRGMALSVLRAERGIALSLAIFTVALLCLAARRQVTLPRNSVVLCAVFTFWFLGDAAALLSASYLQRGQAYVVNDVLALLEIGSYLGWTMWLSKSEESYRRPWAWAAFLAGNTP